MTILYFILLVIAIFVFSTKKRNGGDTFWNELFKVVTLKITDYYCKGSPTKVVMFFMKVICILFELTAIGYPTIKAAISQNEEKGFWSLFIEFQWDTMSNVMTISFLFSVVIVVIVYLICNKKEDKIINFYPKVIDGNIKILSKINDIQDGNTHIKASVDGISTQVDALDNKVQSVISYLDNGDNNIAKHLLLDLKNSIENLNVITALQYLQTIWKEIELSDKDNFKLKASIQYLMGECARYVKGVNSRDYHEKAYKFMHRGGDQDREIIGGMVFEFCRKKDFDSAKQYATELEKIDPWNPWCYVPSLMVAEDLKNTFNNLPVDKVDMTALALCIMMGGGKSHDLGVDLSSYSYHDLTHLSTENFPLWILDLSVATTLFCQNLVVYRNIKLMSNEYSQKVFSLTGSFLSLLEKTEIENPLPDTVFLHAVTGYFKDQDRKWLEIIENTEPTASMSEIYYLTYAVILNDASEYNSAKQLLSQYKGEDLASILNMRCLLASQNNDFQECVEVFNYSGANHVVVPDHLANFYFGTVRYSYDSVKDEAPNIEFINSLTKESFCLFLDYILGKDIDVEFIESNKDDFHVSILPYMAMVAKEKISLEFAISMLEKCVDRKILDMRSSLLIDYYLKDSKYSQKLYYLLKDLRKANMIDVRNLSIELKMSNRIGDYKNSLEITRNLIEIQPEDEATLVNHLQALLNCGGFEEEILSYKEIFRNKIFAPQSACTIFDTFHIIGDTPFAVEFIYNQIELTKNQDLKDYYLAKHLISEVDAVISASKEIVGVGDYVTINLKEESKDVVVAPGSVYEALVGCKRGGMRTITLKVDTDVTVTEIHTKYFKLLRDIFSEIGESNSSRTIKTFTLDDYDFQNDPLGALQKIVGRTEDFRAKEQTLLQKYRSGDMSLLCFIKDREFYSDMYDKIFGNFMVCSMPNEYFEQFLSENGDWKQKELVLDISSVIALHEFDMKFGLHCDIKFNVPMVVVSVLKDQIINEEKGMPIFLSKNVVDRISLEILDNSKTVLWNKLKSIERWIENRCKVLTVEEIINLNLPSGNDLCFRIEAESLLLSSRGMILLSEDWCCSLRFFPIMSSFNWLSLMGIENADKWGQTMLECGNVGYPMTATYVRSQYDLATEALPNNYQTCLANTKFYPFSWEKVTLAAKSILEGVLDPSKIFGATNMMTILFQNLDENMCRMIIEKETIGSRNKVWIRCLTDALKISHPLILPQ